MWEVSLGGSGGGIGRGKTNHAMPSVLGVRLQNAVSGRVIASGVHGVGAGLVERGGEADIACRPARNCDFLFRHCDLVYVMLIMRCVGLLFCTQDHE
jgi:hypothetical protein